MSIDTSIHNDTKTQELIEKLFEKFRLSGQNTNDYLEGLLVANYEPYWKYISLESLLSLQNPKTDIPDEMIFVVYHQITELYFKLILHEIYQIKEMETPSNTALERCLVRCNRYFKNLIDSFDIMIDGMEHQQFLQFRMALLPASGFQSAQFRKIEFCATDLQNLAPNATLKSDSIAELYNQVYWKQGAMDMATQQKTLTLVQFEKKYDSEFIQLIEEYKTKNLNHYYQDCSDITEKTLRELKQFDVHLNINWRLSHYRSAVRYLASKNGDTAATGGTNWQKYLPPRFQKIQSFPALWTAEEKEEWGKSWVREQFDTQA